jgi:predicted solute-binding protein
MTYPIAHIPYANMAPFKEMGPPEGCVLVDYFPKDSIQALKDRRVWAAAVPVGGLSMLTKETAFIGHFGVAVKAQAMSVLFFSDRPFNEFSHSMTISLTGESASSVRLLYLLLGYQNGFDAMPSLLPKGHFGNGYLVIGDRALRWAHEYESSGAARGYTHVTDLAVKWFQRFQLPFVFARWVVHVDAPEILKGAIRKWLKRFAGQEEELIIKAAPNVAARLDLPIDFVTQYLRVIRRCLSHEDEAGQLRFMEELKAHASPILFPKTDGSGLK